MKPIAIDLVLSVDRRLYVNYTSYALAECHGRRVLRVCELIPGEKSELHRRIGALIQSSRRGDA